MNNEIYDLILEGSKLLILMMLPIVVGGAISGILISFFQSIMSIQDPSTVYAFKLLSLVLVMYLMLPFFIRSTISFSNVCFSP